MRLLDNWITGEAAANEKRAHRDNEQLGRDAGLRGRLPSWRRGRVAQGVGGSLHPTTCPPAGGPPATAPRVKVKPLSARGAVLSPRSGIGRREK